MNHKEITLDSMSRNFEFEKQCREIDSIEDLDGLREITKAYVKLYLKQQETISLMF